MSDCLRYKGKILGEIHAFYEDSSTKFNIVVEGIAPLEQLFGLGDPEILEIDGMPPTSFREFKKDIIGRTKKIYLSTHEYNLDFHPAAFPAGTR